MTSRIVFEFTSEEQKALVRKAVGTNEDDIRQSISSIRSWLVAQPHLPHVIDDDRLERMYISSKCRTEKVKKMLESYYTLKSKLPDILMNRDPLGEDVKVIPKYGKVIMMPRLTPDFHRIGILTGVTDDVSYFDMTTGVKAALMAIDFVLSFDYSIGFIFLTDLKNVTAAHLTRLTIRDVRAMEIICRKAYSKRIVGIHFVNASNIIEKLLSFARLVFSEKIKNRIVVHTPDSKTLFQYVPEEFVPNEMGGTGGHVDELSDVTWNLIAGYREWFLEEDKYIVDESKRLPDTVDDWDLFGVDGSFKKLVVD